MINWKVRLKNKQFWLAVIPAVALVAQAVAAVFGYTINLETLVGKLLGVVNAVFALLVILGVVVDPTTEGIRDSARAMTYEEPYPYTPEMSMEEGMNPDPEDQPCPPMPVGVDDKENEE